MNRKLMTLAICLFTSTTLMHAQSFLSQNHAIKRVITSDKYILLPVEEDENNAHIRVIKDNQVVKEFNCKLAINKTDYSVPLDISEYGGDVLLDIQFTGDKRSIGLIKDFVCWKDIKLSNVFDTKNREKFRPIYHHTPAYGWMNDPNGMFYKDGVWHLYYQYNPYGSQWENMTWAHSTSTDLMHWENQGEVIQPDALGTIFSGNSVVDKENTAGFGKDVVIAFYTSAGNAQTQSIAYSTDNGMSFKKYANNPIITSDVPDFRDPKVFWNDDLNQWNLILASGQQMNIYSSKNLKDWKYESCFGEEYGNHGGVWECPDLLKIGDKWVLICNINPGKFVYASTRLKGDGITIFRVNGNGTLTRVGKQSTGKHPRNFAITPNGKFLLVACRDANKIQVFSRDKNTGMLKNTNQDIHLSHPVCVRFYN